MPPHPTSALAVTAASTASFLVVCVVMIAPFLYRIVRTYGAFRVGHYVLLNEMTRARAALQTLYLLRGSVDIFAGLVYLIVIGYQYGTSVADNEDTNTSTSQHAANKWTSNWTFYDTFGVVAAGCAIGWGALLLWWGW